MWLKDNMNYTLFESWSLSRGHCLKWNINGDCLCIFFLEITYSKNIGIQNGDFFCNGLVEREI